jgi:hypothetical protein
MRTKSLFFDTIDDAKLEEIKEFGLKYNSPWDKATNPNLYGRIFPYKNVGRLSASQGGGDADAILLLIEKYPVDGEVDTINMYPDKMR